MAAETEAKGKEETEERTEVKPADLVPGALVVDREDDDPDPDPAIVLNTPPVSAAGWDIPNLQKSVAEDNPDYPGDDPVVVVAYMEHLDENHPGWRGHEGYWPMAEINDQRIQNYTFPLSRLRPADADESEGEIDVDEAGGDTDVDEGGGDADVDEGDEREPEAEPEPEPDVVLDLDPIAARLESGGCAVREQDDKLRVSKLGEMYLIKKSGQVLGEGALRDRIEEVVGELADDQEVEG